MSTSLPLGREAPERALMARVPGSLGAKAAFRGGAMPTMGSWPVMGRQRGFGFVIGRKGLLSVGRVCYYILNV